MNNRVNILTKLYELVAITPYVTVNGICSWQSFQQETDVVC